MDMLTSLSNALNAHAVAARAFVAAIALPHERFITATIWGADLIVASEQSLPPRDALVVVAPGGASVDASVAGRDPATNVALLRLAHPLSVPSVATGEASAGELAFAYGADGAGSVSARMGLVNFAGPEWLSNAGGRIDRRIVLDMRLSAAEEGGPVFDAAGALLGITTLGPAAQVLVIPVATINRIVPALSTDGRVARGWLGIALHPVAVPDGLQHQAGQASGLMVMALTTDGPGAKAGLIAGDIVLDMNGTPARRPRSLARQLGTDSIGRKADFRVIRSGSVLSLQATIEPRPEK